MIAKPLQLPVASHTNTATGFYNRFHAFCMVVEHMLLVAKPSPRPWTNTRTLSMMRIDIKCPQRKTSEALMCTSFRAKREKTAVGQIVATDRGVEGVSDLAVVCRRASLGLGLPRHVIDLEVVHALRRHPTRVVFLVVAERRAR